MLNNTLPSTSQQPNIRYLKMARHAAPVGNDNDEMDEYAPLRMTILLIGVLICLLIYFLLKVWRRRENTRIPIKQSKDSTSGGWTTALLEEVSDDDELFLR